MIAFLAFAASAAEFEKPFELSFHAGSTTNRDPAWDLFDSGNSLPTFGVRLGYRVAPHVVVLGTWGAVRQGASVSVGQDSFVAAATANHVALGAKLDASLDDALLPSISVHGVALPTLWRLDDDPSVVDPIGQVRAMGVPLGVEVVAGAELRIPPNEMWAIAGWFELGGAYYSRARFGDLGTMQPGGFVGRGGVGFRF